MRGKMAGAVGHDKENTPAPSEGKKRRSSGTGSVRRLSISGSKSHLRHLKTIANRFKRKAGAGRGRILVHRPLCLDGSPFEFDSRSDGENRKSFVVFEDGVDSGCSKTNDITTGLEITVPPTAGFKNGKFKTLKPQVSESQTPAKESVQQNSKYHSLESLPAFRARAKAVFAAQSRPLPVALSVEAANQEDSGLEPSVESKSRRLPRGRTGNVNAHCLLDKSELDDIEQLFKKLDEEDLQEELYRHALEREMPEHDLTNEMQEVHQREHEQQFVSAEVSEVPETVKIHMEEEANTCALAREPPDSQDLRLLSPMIGGLDPEVGVANVELSTPQLRPDQEESIPMATPVIVELGDSPESSEFDRAIKQLTPPVRLPSSGCKDKDLGSLQQISGEVEPRHAQNVNDAQVWSVELDPSRRRRDAMEEYKYWCTPWSERLAESSLRAANQMPGSSSDLLRNFDMPSSSLNFSQLDTNGPAKNLVEAYEGEFRSTNLSISPEKDQSRDAERFDCGPSHRPDPATLSEDEMLAAMILIERETRTSKGSKATLRKSWSYWPDQSPMRPVDMSAHCVGNIYEKPSESSLESPSLQATELLRKVESAIATTPLEKVSFDSIRMSPTPPKDICFYLGMSEEELTRRWLQFCASSSVFSDFRAKKNKSWKVESPFAELTCSDPTTSFPREQVLQRTLEDLFPISGEEAVSSDGQDWKTSPHNGEVLPNAEGEGVSSDGLNCKASAQNGEVLPNAEGEGVCSDGLDCKTSAHNEEVLPNDEEEAVSSDGLDCKTSAHNEEVLPNAEEVALSSDGSDGEMDYENDHDDMSNDTTQIIQTGASTVYNDQEVLSALKECQQEDEALGDVTGNPFDLLPLDLTPLKDINAAVTITDPAMEYSLTNLDEEHIDQFMSSLQVTPTVDEQCVERSSINGEEVSKVSYDVHTPSGKAECLSRINELVTPAKDASRSSPEAQVECTPVQKQTKTSRPRKSRKTKKVDSPLDAGSKWSNGKRQSTRIRSKPLDWWRGERMLYGRVHSTLNTLIGIKHLSPDPVWPRPRTGDRKNKVGPQKFKVDSFVSDEHNELLRLAAQ